MFTISCRDGIPRRVEGYYIIIPGLEAYKFFVHNSLDHNGDIEEDLYTVSEESTGYCIVQQQYGGASNAIKHAIKIVKATGYNTVINSIESVREELGINNPNQEQPASQ